MPNISKANLKTILIPLPPIELQNHFAAIVTKVESLKAHYTKSVSNLESLYGILSQKAFKGELDLLRVSLTEGDESVNRMTSTLFNHCGYSNYFDR